MCSVSACAGLEALSPVNKPVAPHCEVFPGACTGSVSTGPTFEDLSGSKGAWSGAVGLRGGCFAPLLACPSPSEPLTACASGPGGSPEHCCCRVVAMAEESCFPVC